MTMGSLSRCLVGVVVALAWGSTAGVSAGQPPDRDPDPPSLAAVAGRIPLGDMVLVTDPAGGTIKGNLSALTAGAVRVRTRSQVRSIAAADVSRIQWQRRDSPLTGVIIGAAVGAVPGIYWLIADPNECTGMCPEEYGLIAVGAVVGGLIDRAIQKMVTVYTATAPRGRVARITVRPVVTRTRAGLQVAAGL